MGRSAPFPQGHGDQGLEESESVGAKAASVFNEGSKDMGASVDRSDGLGGRPISIEFAVLV